MIQKGSSLYKVKLARQIEELKENGETARCSKPLQEISHRYSPFADDFTVLPTFVPTDTLEHLKNCRKNTRKSADAVAEFASSKGPKMLLFLFTTSKCMRV